jgi:hypothetical protein
MFERWRRSRPERNRSALGAELVSGLSTPDELFVSQTSAFDSSLRREASQLQFATEVFGIDPWIGENGRGIESRNENPRFGMCDYSVHESLKVRSNRNDFLSSQTMSHFVATSEL